MWLFAGAAAAAVGRLLRPGRPQSWWGEALMAPVVSVLAGLLATLLDFGGWREPDWRAGLFSFLAAFAALGIVRLIRLTSA